MSASSKLGEYFSYVVFFVFLVIVSGIIHELGHLVVLSVNGVPAFGLRTDILSGSLFLFSHDIIEDDFVLSLVRYSGGFFSAFVLFLFYIFKRSFFNKNHIFGIILLLVMGMHLSQGINEGAFNEDYFSSGLLYAPLHVNAISVFGMLAGPLCLIYYKRSKMKN